MGGGGRDGSTNAEGEGEGAAGVHTMRMKKGAMGVVILRTGERSKGVPMSRVRAQKTVKRVRKGLP